MLLEKLCYNAGQIAADMVFVMTTRRYGVLSVASIRGFAKTYALIDKSAQAITDNVFACLIYID